MKKIWIPYSDRSEIGLLDPVIKRIKSSEKLELILTDIREHVKYLEKNSSLGKVFEWCYEFLDKNKADIALIGFDRREMLFAALAAHHNKIPIVHIYAGDAGTNSPDELYRFIISKLGNVLCSTSEESKQNLIKAGEKESKIHVVGSTAFDDVNIPSLDDFRKKYNLPEKFDLVLFHPDPFSKEETENGIKKVFELVDKFTIVGYPNRDKYNEIVIKEIEKHKDNVLLVKNFPDRNDYLAALKYCQRAIGNSSSFVLEAPYFNTEVVQIGQRNRNRTKSKIITGGSDKIVEILENL